MELTLLLTFVCIVGVFLMLFSAVAFIQDKRFFGTAPKDVQEKVQVREERFLGMHVLGYVLCIVAIAMIIGSVVIEVWYCIKCRMRMRRCFCSSSMIFTPQGG